MESQALKQLLTICFLWPCNLDCQKSVCILFRSRVSDSTLNRLKTISMKPLFMKSIFVAAGLLLTTLIQAQCDQTLVTLEHTSGTFPSETSFLVMDADGTILLESMPAGSAGDVTTYELCVGDGCYTVVLMDSFGDGWNGGELSAFIDGENVMTTTLQDGDYGISLLSVNGGEDCVSADPIGGCTDAEACNYDETATFNDYSCTYPGCNDPEALNYNQTAGCDDDSCVYPPACDATTLVLQSNAEAFDGYSGSYVLVDVDGNEIASGALDAENAMTTFCLEDGCYGLMITANEENPFGLYWSLLALGSSGWGISPSDFVELNAFSVTEGEIVAETCGFSFGCSDMEACNYDELADYDDGSCTYPGCLDPAAINFDYNAGCDDGSCEYCSENGMVGELYVCTFSQGYQVEFEILDDEGNVIIEVSGLGDMAIEYYSICLEEGICYTVNMTNNSGTGWNGGYWWVNALGYQVGTGALEDGLSSDVVYFSIDDACPAYGCTDPEALNYDADADTDDGSCEYPEPCDFTSVIITMNDSFGDGWNGGTLTLTDEAGNEVYNGTLENGSMGSDAACLEDGCYIVAGETGTFTAESSYSISVNGVVVIEGTPGDLYTLSIGDSPCEVVFGCTDAAACNYDAAATTDNGTCVFPGCQDPAAMNFDAFAGCEDNSLCEYCDEGGVIAQLYICTFANGNEVEMEILDSEGNEVVYASGMGDVAIEYIDICLIEGECYTVNMYNNVSDGGWYGGYFWVSALGYEMATGSLSDGETFGTLTFSLDGSCSDAAMGCTDPIALNYDVDAEEDDGSCEYGPGATFDDPMHALGIYSVAPNPFYEFVDVEVRGVSTTETGTVVLHDLAGRLVLETTFQSQGLVTRVHLDASELEAGQYVMTVTSGNQASSELVWKK